MGGVQSKIKILWQAIRIVSEANRTLQELLQRASEAPGLPVPNPSPSYWLEDPPYPEIVHAASPELPSRADIVIIGSGITAAAVARSVLHESARRAGSGAGTAPAPRVVVLEARSLCSGATGRNGGHIKSSPHEVFAQLRKRFGPERAAAITRFQLSHVKVLTELCRAEGWDIAECREVETCDLFLDAESRDKAVGEVEELKKWVPELEVETWDAAAAQKKFEANEFVVGAISYPAGALWPFRFVSCVWKDLLTKYGGAFSIETDTAATDILPLAGEDMAYKVVTTRGDIQCNHVVHATNAFAGQLIPSLRGKLTGTVAHMSAQRPGKNFPDLDGARSWLVVYGQVYDYVTQRPTVDGIPGDLMLGGGFDRGKDQGMDRVGRWDDSTGAFDVLTLSHIGNIFPTIFSPQWGDDQEGGRIKRAWTGIVAVTGDLLPFVGRLHPKLTNRRPAPTTTRGGALAGEWVSAGYCGDGMVWAWLSGTALGVMLLGCEKEDLPEIPGRPGGRVDEWFPPELGPSPERVKNADLINIVEQYL